MTPQDPHQQQTGRPAADAVAPAAPARKPFVEPKISSPVDVLEATTFFQVVDSGGTGLRRGGQ